MLLSIRSHRIKICTVHGTHCVRRQTIPKLWDNRILFEITFQWIGCICHRRDNKVSFETHTHCLLLSVCPVCVHVYGPNCKEYYLIYSPVESSIRNALEFSLIVFRALWFLFFATCDWICVCCGRWTRVCTLLGSTTPLRYTRSIHFSREKIKTFAPGTNERRIFFNSIDANWVKLWNELIACVKDSGITVPFSGDLLLFCAVYFALFHSHFELARYDLKKKKKLVKFPSRHPAHWNPFSFFAWFRFDRNNDNYHPRCQIQAAQEFYVSIFWRIAVCFISTEYRTVRIDEAVEKNEQERNQPKKRTISSRVIKNQSITVPLSYGLRICVRECIRLCNCMILHRNGFFFFAFLFLLCSLPDAQTHTHSRQWILVKHWMSSTSFWWNSWAPTPVCEEVNKIRLIISSRKSNESHFFVFN